MTMFKVHFQIAETREKKTQIVQAETPDDAKKRVQSVHGGLRLIFDKVKVDREAAQP